MRIKPFKSKLGSVDHLRPGRYSPKSDADGVGPRTSPPQAQVEDPGGPMSHVAPFQVGSDQIKENNRNAMSYSRPGKKGVKNWEDTQGGEIGANTPDRVYNPNTEHVEGSDVS